MVTPLIVNAPFPVPSSETVVARLALFRFIVVWTAPSVVVLVIVFELLVYKPATWRKLLVSALLPRVIGLLLERVILSAVES